MRINKATWIFIVGLFALFAQPCAVLAEGVETHHLDKVKNNLCDKASLQRGAQLYMNYCSGCHALSFIRFDNMAKDLGIVNKEGKVLEKVVMQNLNFITDKVTSPLTVALPKKDAEKWFGVAPPDLSLVARSRGTNWLYTYLLSFYEDPKRPWGVNNLVFPDVGMPNVLQGLQGTQEAVYKTITMKDENGQPYQKEVIDHLVLKSKGSLDPKEYDAAITDLVNFLDYVGEPHQGERKRLGVWVLLFLVVFTLFAYLLKREYWKDIH